MILKINVTNENKFKLVSLFKYIIDPPDYFIKLAIDHGFENMKYIKDPDNWIFYTIKVKGPYIIQHFKNPTKEAQLYALSFVNEEEYMTFIRDYIDNPCREVLFQDTLYTLKLKVWRDKKVNLVRSRKKIVLE